MDVRLSDATLGAYIRGIDLRTVDDATFQSIEQVWLDRAVIVFPEQHLDDDAHIALSRRFGRLERQGMSSIEGNRPEIYLVSNQHRTDGLDADGDAHLLVNRGNQFWHSDSSYKSVPSKASLLRAEKVPSSGGDTEFADMRAAYDALDQQDKDDLDDAVAVHSYRYSQSLIGGLDLMTEEELAAIPPVEHAIVKVHPKTDRRSLFIGRHASHIVGRAEEAGRATLQRLCHEACQPPRVFRHRWSAGDLVLWDNRCVLHRGRPWPSEELRIMHRTTVAGESVETVWMLDATTSGRR